MIQALLSQPAIVSLVLVLILSLICLVVGYIFASKGNADEAARDENAFGLGQTAIFGLIVLILAFSFSFAADRFEARRALVVEESVDVGDSYAHTDFLPPKRRDIERDLIRKYVAARIGALGEVGYHWEEGPQGEKAHALHAQLWSMATADVRADRHNVAYLALAEDFDKMGDTADFQIAAINNHVPLPILGIVVLCTLVGAALLGLTFGRVRSPNRALSVIFCVIFAATVFTIVDMDHPSGGLIQIDVAPLQNALDEMKH